MIAKTVQNEKAQSCNSSHCMNISKDAEKAFDNTSASIQKV